MNKRVLSLIAATGIFGGLSHAAEVVVNTNIVEDEVWTSDNEYVLDGFIFVKNGASLTIEPGTTILAETGVGEDASALIIARGSKIFALGAPSAPIVFTSVEDPRDGSWDVDQGGAWGGLIVLGAAPLNSNAAKAVDAGATFVEDNIEGVPVPTGSEGDVLFGGENVDDSSGVIRYVSIRFGGSALASDDEINGLTLGGVGRGTIVEFVEIFGNSDDAIEFFGGNVNVRFIAAAFQGDDGFDYDQGWNGRGQFWFNISSGGTTNPDFTADNGGEHDGETAELGFHVGGGEIWNATYIGDPAAAGGFALRLRDDGYMKYYNSLFTGHKSGQIRIEPNSASRIADGSIELMNNLFSTNVVHGNEADTLGAGGANVDDDESYIFTDATLMNSVADPKLEGISYDLAGNGGLDPRPMWSSPALSNSVKSVADDPWLIQTSYQGAFGRTNWLYGWTYLDEAGYLKMLDEPSQSSTTAVSSIIRVEPGDTPNIGFTVTGDLPRMFIIRAKGPKLAEGASIEPGDVLPDPWLRVVKLGSPNREVALETTWLDRADPIDTLSAWTGLATLRGTESRPIEDETSAVAFVTLAPGLYTASARNVDTSVGGLVQIEVYMTDF